MEGWRAGGREAERDGVREKLREGGMQQLGSLNLAYKCSTISSGNLFILGSKGQRSRSQST